MTANNM